LNAFCPCGTLWDSELEGDVSQGTLLVHDCLRWRRLRR
jgi:hypothetical protein